jgi:hypothetical protein
MGGCFGVNGFGNAHETPHWLYWSGDQALTLNQAERRIWMHQLRRPLHLLTLLVGVLALTLAVAACGGGGNSDGVASLSGSDKPTTTTNANSGKGNSQDKVQAARNWARCMRQHGINLPDPKLTGDGIGQQLPAEVNSPKFKAAEQACRQYQLGDDQSRPPSAQERQQALAFARCMRQHGVNMPDPKITANGIEQPPPTGAGRDDKPRLRAALQACERAVPPARR